MEVFKMKEMDSFRIYGYLMDKETGGMIGVNRFGLLIAGLYQAGKEVDEIVEICEKQQYATSVSRKKIEAMVTEFIEKMQQKGLTQERVRAIKTASQYQLLTVQLDLSWDCNLSCRHCYLGDVRLIGEPLTKEEWRVVIDQIYKMHVPKIVFLGGEPLLSPYLFDLAKYAYELGFKIFTTTNGTLVTPKIASQLHQTGFNEIDVSLDGATIESHEFLRGKGTFKQTIRGINSLIFAGLQVKSATVLYKKNFTEVPELLKLGRSIGLKQMYFNPLLSGGTGKKIWRDCELSFKEWRIVKEIVQKWNKSNNEPKAFAESGFDFKGVSTYVNLGGCEYAGCKAGKRELIITPDGFAVACPLLSTERQFHTINIREYSLEEIWQRDEWVVKLRQVDETTLQGKCRECPNLIICKGGCHILSLFECGNINQPDPRCPLLTN